MITERKRRVPFPARRRSTPPLARMVPAAALALLAARGWAEPPPEPPVEAQASYQVVQPEGLPSRMLGDQPSAVRSLDPAIFIELSPVTAAEPAVRLPDDQRDED